VFGLIQPVPPRGVQHRLGKLPGMGLRFEREGARYAAHGIDYRLSVSASETVLTYLDGFGDVDNWSREERLRVQLVGASPAGHEAPAMAERDWVLFQDVYPKIDLECGGTAERLEYRFFAAAGADSRSIRIRFEGAGRVRVDGDGSVTARTPVGVIRIYPPVTDDPFDGERRPVGGRFERRGNGLVEFQPGR
jgi:hypothetical protein